MAKGQRTSNTGGDEGGRSKRAGTGKPGRVAESPTDEQWQGLVSQARGLEGKVAALSDRVDGMERRLGGGGR